MTTHLTELLGGARIVPVLTVPDPATAAPLADALAAGGAHCAEVTFRTTGAEQAVKTMAAHGGLVVGAGTILTPDQAERAVAAGARFVVSPGLDDDVVTKCRELGVPVVPGVATATELMRALRAGVDTVKLFPAEAIGGLRTLRALAAPFPQAHFMPTGGIGPDLLTGYLAEPSVVAVGGSWMATPAHLEHGEYAEIGRLTAEAVRRSTRSNRSTS
ncbi:MULTISPECIES: bifunctional 4-hydroxy-2-oxoglutarate aldolase/2-dehydro-3-deoxy-phosphogluconate aldolase [Streptomyces]|uniref:Putative KHG/KDPG aldolase [includes: 4-hydroxy-2-oxoglutarate aldolase 2-dehydro-3-deoxy-phosphogluconate aldolase] n=1 Tax=Streptomyces scabiei (strain 87.22) TaxID=680198 RepID=C9YX68_STRSW|nr:MULTISPECIES: bifunctional 4-hydroxy-2-oxoglutarate aldolase/2-dehydro-3-deoxy-phosphogluconate aldolase [Streptomyces]MBP5909488.1 bifunctional 4-hydroxy-2-oxoglutarate aldolase/2-dehydro-3-deoxy-phosphogluconate aldolase [Streptomyces sp. LBUM 1478]KFG03878.1 keto-deoxy-phosphogluconate aldolase [Streptomyces scabiei]MBP5889304.1 bifunctional 4-hydroxy-2-oxoglutarate aldolase/2-dehydro-3-deoxy-phosphogluconate aldolase [Streptomyces sp. LBUM 1481]MBP5919329.1 bifunctional 4-hydroxy-2-oxogl